MGILSEGSLGINMMRLARQEHLKCKYHSLNDSKYLFCGGTGAQLNDEKMTENILSSLRTNIVQKLLFSYATNPID